MLFYADYLRVGEGGVTMLLGNGGSEGGGGSFIWRDGGVEGDVFSCQSPISTTFSPSVPSFRPGGYFFYWL